MAVRLYRIPTRSVRDKTYYKWVLNPPPEAIDTLGWKEGDELEVVLRKGQLILRRVQDS